MVIGEPEPVQRQVLDHVCDAPTGQRLVRTTDPKCVAGRQRPRSLGEYGRDPLDLDVLDLGHQPFASAIARCRSKAATLSPKYVHGLSLTTLPSARKCTAARAWSPIWLNTIAKTPCAETCPYHGWKAGFITDAAAASTISR
jgi:hypothetical protein